MSNAKIKQAIHNGTQWIIHKRVTWVKCECGRVIEGNNRTVESQQRIHTKVCPVLRASTDK